MSCEPKPIIIDTDPGIDDAVSILWMLDSKAVEVKAITVTNGNVGIDWCVTNALRVLEVGERTDIPVYRGAYRPLARPCVHAAWIHGSDGLGNCGYPLPKIKARPGYAPVEMIRIAKESPQPITIVSLAPLTNVALAILLDPDFVSHVKEVVFMGGVMQYSGNQSPRASFNVAVDPEAAKVVYNSGIPVVQIGLDVCDFVTERLSDIQRISVSDNAVARFVSKAVDFTLHAVRTIYDENGNVISSYTSHEEGNDEDRKQGIGLNDLVCTAYVINPEWFGTKHVTIDIETSGLCAGETIVDVKGLWGRSPNAYWAFEVDGRAIVEQWIKDITRK